MSGNWTDKLVGARMRVDSEFTSEVDNSQFSRQEWSLIMTAVEFDVENPGDPGEARLVADTTKIRDILPEVQRVAEMQGMQAYGRQRSSGLGPSLGGGLLDTVKDALGLGGGRSDGGGSDGGGSGGGVNRGDTVSDVDEETVSAAASLVDHYASRLQSHLERKDRWEEVRLAALDDSENR